MEFQYFATPPKYDGKYLFVSDLHGSENLFPKLMDIATKKTPKIVFFLGNTIGTEALKKVREMFFEYVTNPAKECLKANPNASDQEFLDFIRYPKKGRTLLMGYQALCDYLKKLDGQNHFQTNPVDHIHQLLEYKHYGHWIANLPESVKNILMAGLRQNAINVINLMNQFVKNNCKVVVIEGNLEARTPLDFFPGTQCVSIPTDQREFYFKDLINQFGKNIKYYDRPGVIQENGISFVVWPFEAAVIPTQVPEIEKNGQKIVLVSHAQVSWIPIKGNRKMGLENQTIEQNMSMVATSLNPNAIVHGHLEVFLPNNVSGFLYQQCKIHYLPLEIYRFINF